MSMDFMYSSTEMIRSMRRPDLSGVRNWSKLRVRCWYKLNPVDWRLFGACSDEN